MQPDDPDKTLPVEDPRLSELLRANAGQILGRMLDDLPEGMETTGGEIGPYRLHEILGEGGFGIVWRAEQTEPVRREAALKVIKPGMDTMQMLGRFNQERQAVASLDHPGIARLINAGVTQDGRPWFAMEMVRGGPVTTWCKNQGATLPQRLQLFIQVCDAVQHAHEKGILHRDLKPSNILVTEVDGAPVPKVIDFGIAKAINAASSLKDLTMLTQADQVLGTPVYMSPEQVEGGQELDARADVYSLGVLLYQLLTDTLPFDLTIFKAGDLSAMKRHILETMPQRPSTRLRKRTTSGTMAAQKTLPSSLPEDLDWIALRALEKSRQRRYASALELAQDVQRHLEHRPVLARPPSWLSATERWMRRHRTGVMAGVSGSLLSGVIVVSSLIWNPSDSYRPAPLRFAADGSYTNGLGMKFVPLPGTDILICAHETRRGDYAQYSQPSIGADGVWSRIRRPTPTGEWVPVGNQDDHPVVAVSWAEAMGFCSWLSEQDGYIYRLPTDAEWSLAVGLQEQRTQGTLPASLSRKDNDHFPWGTGFPPKGEVAGNYGDAAWHKKFTNETWLDGYDDGFATTSPVMRFKPNKLGIYDLGGNASEWCEDWFDKTLQQRVTRGGCYMDADRDRLLASVRGAGDPFQHYSGTGFRCVLERKPPRTAPVYEPPEKGAAGRSGPYTPPKALPLARFPAPLPANEVARRTVTNSLGMKFIPVPGAKVLFCIHETRQKDYEAFASDVKDASPGGTWRKVIFAGVEDVKGPDHPVSCISYDQAKLFCSWLSKKEGRTYRLPTDHEWSVAVGLGEVERDDPGVTPQMKGAVGRMEFPFGEKMPSKDTPRVGNYRDATFHERGLPDKWIEDYVDGYALSAPVMSFPPNAFGLYDMGGNVWEWVSDWATKLQDKRVIRGGSFVDLSPGTLQSACRYPVNSNAEQYNHGFRVVLEEVMPASSR